MAVFTVVSRQPFIYGRFYPKTVKVRSYPGNRGGGPRQVAMPPSWIKPSPRSTTALRVRPIDPHVLMSGGLIPEDRHDELIHELGSFVPSEAFDDVTDVGQEFRRCRGHVDLAPAPEGAEPSHARRVILEQDQAQAPPSRRYFPGAGKVNENALQGLGQPRGSRRRHRRTPSLRLHALTAGRVLSPSA